MVIASINVAKNPIYTYEYNGKCSESFNKGFIIDENTNEKICKYESEKCLHCPPCSYKI